MINLEKEVTDYVSLAWGTYENDVSQISELLTLGEISTKDYLAGVDSKYVQAKIIQAQIDLCNRVLDWGNEVDPTSDYIEKELYGLQEQLKQLQK